MESLPGLSSCCERAFAAEPERAENEKVVACLKALAHPVRLGIMRILATSENAVCACDLEANFDLTQPTISHHLRVLREAGLVEAEARNPWVYFSLVRGSLGSVKAVLDELI